LLFTYAETSEQPEKELERKFLKVVKKQSKVLNTAFFFLKNGKFKMKKGDKEMKVWGSILVPVILSGFRMGFEGGVKG